MSYTTEYITKHTGCGNPHQLKYNGKWFSAADNPKSYRITICPTCGGAGQVNEAKCPRCKGQGVV